MTSPTSGAVNGSVRLCLRLEGLAAAGRGPILSLIWAAHIGIDRLAGYGLKYPSDFHDTHLGRIGR